MGWIMRRWKLQFKKLCINCASINFHWSYLYRLINTKKKWLMCAYRVYIVTFIFSSTHQSYVSVTTIRQIWISCLLTLFHCEWIHTRKKKTPTYTPYNNNNRCPPKYAWMRFDFHLLCVWFCVCVFFFVDLIFRCVCARVISHFCLNFTDYANQFTGSNKKKYQINNQLNCQHWWYLEVFRRYYNTVCNM